MTETLTDCVHYSVHEHIARVVLNRPARRNAINAAMHERLREVLNSLESDPAIRVVIFTGAGEAFCGGQDLAERGAMLGVGEVDLEHSLRTNYNPLIRRLMALPMPLIGAIHGPAAGAGAALALAMDITLAARSARFQLSFARVGLGLDSGLSWLLPRSIGQARALGMALSAEPIDASRAEQWGLIWRVVDDEHLHSEADALARALAAGPQSSLRVIKRQLRALGVQTLESALDAESAAQGALGRGSDYREAVTAFLAKRTPRFE